jgi:hypothetical protein
MGRPREGFIADSRFPQSISNITKSADSFLRKNLFELYPERLANRTHGPEPRYDRDGKQPWRKLPRPVQVRSARVWMAWEGEIEHMDIELGAAGLQFSLARAF